MGSVPQKMSHLMKMDNYFDSFRTGKNAVVDSWFMMSRPATLMAVLVAYLIFVLRLGPMIMRKRPALKLTRIMTYYNAAQVLLSAIICYKSIRLNLFRDGILNAGCSYPGTTQNIQLLDCGWWYFLAKFTELLDTVFFVLRKKDKQVSFLHVYHHAVMSIYSWSYLKFEAGGQGAVLALMNSMVHVVMYTYYLLAAFGPHLQKYLWWKKYVTSMQMVQFIFMLIYCIVTHLSPNCSFSKGFTYFITTNVSIFLLLFLNFYRKSYKRSASAALQVKESSDKVKNGRLKCDESLCDRRVEGKCPSSCLDKAKQNDDDRPLEIGLTFGDYVKDERVLTSRRKVQSVYGNGCEGVFESKIK